MPDKDPVEIATDAIEQAETDWFKQFDPDSLTDEDRDPPREEAAFLAKRVIAALSAEGFAVVPAQAVALACAMLDESTAAPRWRDNVCERLDYLRRMSAAAERESGGDDG